MYLWTDMELEHGQDLMKIQIHLVCHLMIFQEQFTQFQQNIQLHIIFTQERLHENQIQQVIQ